MFNIAAIAATALLAVLAIARVLDPLPEGLTATYFRDAAWSSAPVRSTLESQPSTTNLLAAWRRRPPETFSATWTGSLIVVRTGTYTFATESDDGSSVYVDKRLVVDNGGAHSPLLAKGSIHLNAGVHTIFITYFQAGGPVALQVLWAQGDSPLEPIPAWALSPGSPRFAQFLLSVFVRRAVPWVAWVWLALVAVVAAPAIWRAALWLQPLSPLVESVLLAAGLLLLVLVLPHHIESDGRARYDAMTALLEGRPTREMPYSLIGPLFAAPLYLLGKLLGAPEWWYGRFNVFIFAAGVAVIVRLSDRRLDSSLRLKVPLLLVAASMFPHHLGESFGEVFTAVLVGVGLLAVHFGHEIAGWSAAIVGVANAPATLVALGAAVVVHTWKTRRVRDLIPVLAAAALVALESWIRRGSPLATGYENNAGFKTILTYSGRPGFSYPLFFGLLSVLFSFGKGLVFYAPGLLLPIKSELARVDSRLRDTYYLWMAFLAGLIVTYAKWWAWYGGWFWGPRFFLFASIPASFALAVKLKAVEEVKPGRALVLSGVLALSTWVAIDGVLFGLNGLDACAFPYTFESLCWYVPEFSALWRPFVVFTPPRLASVIVAAYCCVVFGWLATPSASAIAREILARVSKRSLWRGRFKDWRW